MLQPPPWKEPVLSVPYSYPHGPSPSPLLRANSARKPGAVPKSGWAKDAPHREEGGTAPWEGVLCQLWVRACRDFWKRWAWGRRESCREGGGRATAPDSGPSFGHLQKGWGPQASPDHICPRWVPGKVGLEPLLPQHGVGARIPSSGCSLFTHWASVCSSLKWRQ